MTLFELLPSLRRGLNPHLDRAIWPLSAYVDELGRLCVGGVASTDIAAEFGTPTYVVDEADFRARIRTYRAALPGVELVYAGEANWPPSWGPKCRRRKSSSTATRRRPASWTTRSLPA